ncbi:hypothetical protein M885DRAFT_611346 [Pelagophyceae sp. CCMP2097]|nr:hypothetical protein M885DRAFT_611346 [Pelagophyceae sp. CCMP2097]|mmetsp:Transcript_12826/g.44367  ORF Transcript_12826/g.44367 Transcript_12826/m.44367 type:complete len:596 (+) Transcript_12826:24-1811(+)
MADFLAAPLAFVASVWDGDAERCAANCAAQVGNGAPKVPLLLRSAYLSGAIQPRTLVRFVGMVQDMANPEYYVTAATVDGAPRYGIFRDDLGAGAANVGPFDAAALASRSPVYCVAAPGQTAWAAKRIAEQGATLAAAPTDDHARQPHKRAADSAADGVRGADGEGQGADGGAGSGDVDMDPGADLSHKAARTAAGPAAPSPSTVSPAAVAGLVMECVARVYPGTGAAPKLNDLVECVAILGGDDAATLGAEREFAAPAADEDAMACQDGWGLDDEDAALWDPPLSQAARLHVVTMRRLPSHYPIDLEATGPLPANELRSAVLARLLSAVGGDALAAEYVLLALLSRVDARVGAAGARQTVGAMSLQLVASDAAAAAQLSTSLHAAVSDLVPRCVLLRASQLAAPKRAAAGAERLERSTLQFSDGTVAVIHVDGAFATPAARAAVQQLAGRAKALVYDFGFTHSAFEVDAPTIVVTTRDFDVSADAKVPHRPADAPPPPPADADALRCYLARARIADVSIDAGAGAAIEAEFVRARAAGSFAADAETAFHRALTRARLLAKSHAAAALGLDHYRRSNALAGEAVNRAANAPPAGQ